jgi:putative endonuclease
MFMLYTLLSIKRSILVLLPNLEQRLSSNNHLLNKGYTAKYKPWIIIYSEEYINKRTALLREKQLKSAQ